MRPTYFKLYLNCSRDVIKGKAVFSTPRRRVEGISVQLHSFSNSALDRGEWSTSGFMHGKEHRYALNGWLGGPSRRFG